ncbi:MAG: hypothetical protein ACRDJU_00160 [Actinomycetota bacterium]
MDEPDELDEPRPVDGLDAPGDLVLLKAFRAEIKAAAPNEGAEPGFAGQPDAGRLGRDQRTHRRLVVVLAVLAAILVGAGTLAGFQLLGRSRGERIRVTGLPPTPTPPPTPVAGPVDSMKYTVSTPLLPLPLV